MVMTTTNPTKVLTTLAHRYFPDIDLVVGEGFKDERQVTKIEVSRGDTDLLRDQVTGVIAIATDRDISGNFIFRLDESSEIADFIEKRFLSKNGRKRNQTVLLVNGKKVVMKDFVQKALAETVKGFVKTLRVNGSDIQEIELRIRIKKE
jgi:molybdopterin-guanine dinucleotide biosynthesis protein B